MFCDYCKCYGCKFGEVHLSHAKTEDGRWICDTCYQYHQCPNGPCDGECDHRPKLVSAWESYKPSGIKRYTIVNWCSVEKELAEIGFKQDVGPLHGTYECTEDHEVFLAAEYIFRSGLNIMIKHKPDDKEEALLFVDDRNFGQR
jgi:hypothetical protein